MAEDRKAKTVWLTPLHQRMLREMPDVQVGDIARKAIEELFEGRNDREYARVCIEEDLADLEAQWERLLGLKASSTVTSTEDGFRVVLVALKDYNG